MNILEAEDMVKGLPDQVLFQYAQNPPPQIPQYLAVSEVQRRQDMRQRYQANQPEQTVKDQILQGGIAAAGGQPPGMGEAPPMAPPGAAPPGAPMQQPMTGAPMAQMYRGGRVRMQEGRRVPSQSDIEAAMKTPPYLRTPEQRALLRSIQEGGTLGNLLAPFNRAVESVRPQGIEAGLPAAAAAMTPPPAPPQAPAAPSVPPPMEAAVMPRPSPPVSAPQAMPVSNQGPAGFIAPDSAGNAFDEMMRSARIPEAPAPVSDRQVRLDEMMTGLPEIVNQIQGLMPSPQSLSMKDLERFAPKPFDDSAIMARREALLNQLQEAGRTRREEDIAAAERYRSEAEAPIKSAQEEARKTAIASTLMRLGAGLAAGNPAQGLANASEAVENIMTRAREQAAAERRAVRQEFRQAEREATRGERDMANTVFQMQAQQITSDENKQRELARDQMQFSQWAFGQMRDQGKDQRQAYESSIRLGAGLLQAVDSAVREEIKNKRISQDQYTSTVGSLIKSATDLVKQYLPTDIDMTTPEGQKTLNDTVKSIVDTQIKNFNIRSPEESGAGVVTVRTPQELSALKSGDRYRGPDGVVRVKP